MTTFAQKIKTAYGFWKQGRKGLAMSALFSDYNPSDPFSFATFDGSFFGLGRTGRDVIAENNSAVMACLNWSMTNFQHGELEVTRKVRNRRESVSSRALNLIKRPNPYYSAEHLFTGTLLSYHLNGNAYWLLSRTRGGRGIPNGVFWVPHWAMKPFYTPGVSEWVDYYEYNFEGRYAQIPVENVIHFRNGVDLQNPRLGRTAFRAALDEVLTDEEAARFTAALMGNFGMPGIVIAPDSENVTISNENRKQMKEEFDRNYGGSQRGSTMVLSDKAKVTTLGFSLKDLEIGTVRHVPEQRIAATLGIPLEVVGLGAGSEQSTYNNVESANKRAYDNHLLPTFRSFARELNYQFLPNFEDDPALRFEFNTDALPVFQESVLKDAEIFDKKVNAVGALVRAGFDPQKSLEAAGLDEIEHLGLLPITLQAEETIQAEAVNAERQAGQPPTLARPKKSIKAEPVAEDNGMTDAHEQEIRAEQERFAGELSALIEQLAIDAATEANNQKALGILEKAKQIVSSLFTKTRVSIFVDAFAAMQTRVESEIERYVARVLEKEQAGSNDSRTSSAKFAKTRAADFVENLEEQTVRAVRTVLESFADGESVEQIARRISSHVSGREMYPNVYQRALRENLENGVSQSDAERAADKAARDYRARVIAETEVRNAVNYQTIETCSAENVRELLCKDGAGCGWTYHDDADKAHNTLRSTKLARKYLIAHPRCQRRFIVPPKKNND